MKKGFTLVEVIVAATVLLAAMGALLFSITSARRSVLLSGTRTAAVQVGRQHMERLLALPYAGSQELNLGTHVIPTTTQLVYGSHSAVTGLFYGSYTVTSNKQVPSFLVKDIDMTIYWTNAVLNRSSSINLKGSMSSPLHP